MTPDDLILRLDEILPGLERHLRSSENLFDADSLHGVFAATALFVRERDVRPEGWQVLGQFMNEAVEGPDRELDEAVCTCFLESLAALDHPLRAHLVGPALAYWSQWE